MRFRPQTSDISRGIPLGANSGEILARIEKLLRSQGISPHPACRYAEYRKILLMRSHGTASAASTQEQLYASAELLQMDWIVSCFAHDRELWPTIERAFFRDPTVPFGSDVHSPGRDLQFELYIAARLTMAGLAPVLAEPDIRVDISGLTVAIAVKRVKSRPGLLAAIKQARDQIARYDFDGIVVVDYSFVAANDTFPYASGDLADGHEWMRQFSKQEFHARWPKIQKILAKSPRVIGVIIVTRLFHLHPDRYTHQISELMFARSTCAPNVRGFEAFSSIEERLHKSVVPERVHAIDV